MVGGVEELLKAKLLLRITELSVMETSKLNAMVFSRVTLKSIMLKYFSIIYPTLDWNSHIRIADLFFHFVAEEKKSDKKNKGVLW